MDPSNIQAAIDKMSPMEPVEQEAVAEEDNSLLLADEEQQHSPEVDDTSPLLSDLSEFHNGRHGSSQRMRRHYIVFFLSLGFVFAGIIFMIWFFALPFLVEKVMGQQVSKRASQGSFTFHPQRLYNVTRDGRFSVEGTVQGTMNSALLWGANVRLPRAKVYHLNQAIASFTLSTELAFERGNDRFHFDRVIAHVRIEDDRAFSEMIELLIKEDRTTINLSSHLLIRPNYFLTLPQVRVNTTIPLQGLPVLLKKFRNASIDDQLLDLNIVRADKKGGLVVKKRFSPLIDLALDVYGDGTDHAFASIDIRRNDGLVFSLPRAGEQVRRLLEGKVDHVNVKPRAQGSSEFLSRVLAHINVLRIPIEVKEFDSVLSLVQEINVKGVFGGVQTKIYNPFPCPLTVDDILVLNIYHVPHVVGAVGVKNNTKKLIAVVKEQRVNQTIKAKSLGIIEQPRQFVSWRGGIKGALAIYREIRARGYVNVSISGTVSVKLGQFPLKRIPVQQDSLKITLE